MKECEMCGWSGELVRASIEGTVLNVCIKCSALGTKMETPQKPEQKPSRLEVSEFIPDFAGRIRSSRLSAGFSTADMARNLGISPSLLSRIEKGMRPTTAVARKLEKQLGITLFYKDTVTVEKVPAAPEMTLGDVVALRIRKR